MYNYYKNELSKRVFSTFKNAQLEIDLIVDGGRFQSLGTAQLNNLSL